MNATTGLLLDYLRLILYPLTILAFCMIAANEYTTTKNWRRIAFLFGIILLLSLLLSLSLLGMMGVSAFEIESVKDFALTPIILFMCMATWFYVLKKSTVSN
jgi:hypothetical protein